ncbi:hypothetical protein GGH94_002581 [Coemansia aciculifera]|uniref:Arrestin-like N-terminal domain-containing protein n=1 Tax=Coemansia aciculifera TaxID=417176 RepID=A0A9W8ISN9_9FUNG|nr:hypothetical protein GGH94_002581 [Coemansia aciculifera]KAJ2877024.1 hypothetical protein GGH93_000288 [Coemansia aciculifera]
MSAPVFEVRFPAYTSGGPPRCTPKSTLAGVVYLHLLTPLQASCLSVNFIGTERISLAPPSANSGHWGGVAAAVAAATGGTQQMPMMHMAKQRSIKKVYFNQSAVLWGDSKLRASDWLADGIHMFHFSCEFPRVNYPQSKCTAEYEIKYVIQAKLLGTRDFSSPILSAAAQPIMFVPETIAPLLTRPADPQYEDEVMARYRFCDNAVDVDEPDQWAFHLQVMGLQQAFCPGDTVDFQLRLTGGQRALRKAQFTVYEQTDCFYPMIPDPHEEQLDLGRRLWSTQRVLSGTADLPFERDSCVMVPDLCPEHMNSKRARGGATYYAHLHTRLPRDVLVMHETGYMRFTYFAELALYSNSAWGGQIKRAIVRIPIPVATRVLPENPAPMSAKPMPASLVGSPSLYSRGSMLVPSISDHLTGRGNFSSSSPSSACHYYSDYAPGCGSVRQAYVPDCVDAEDPDSELSLMKRGRSIADLGNRLQQLIPRKTPSSIYSPSKSVRGIESSALSTPRQAFRAVSHGGYIESPSSWSVVDLVPPIPRAFYQHQVEPSQAGQASQISLFGPSATRTTAISANDEAVGCSGLSLAGASPLRTVRHSSNRTTNMQPAALGLATSRGHGGGFSLTFLLALREFYHADANSLALDDYISGLPCETNNCVIPSAISSHSSHLGKPLGFNTMGAKQWNTGGSIRSSMISVSGVLSASERARPKLGHVMTSYRNPNTNQVSTWSAFSSYPLNGCPSMTPQQKPGRQPVHLRGGSVGGGRHPGGARCPPSARHSQLSATSVSSNDTACVPNGQLSLTKEVPQTIPTLLGAAINELPSGVESNPNLVNC